MTAPHSDQAATISRGAGLDLARRRRGSAPQILAPPQKGFVVHHEVSDRLAAVAAASVEQPAEARPGPC